MATNNTGLLSQANTITPAQASSPSQVSVNVSAPESRSYSGFDENKSYDNRASDFKVSDDSLVENRMTGLLGSNSDYMKRAKGTATVASNRRGLLSSSIAAGAGASAAIDAALPIAQQDANTFAQSDLTKQNYFNDQSLAEQQAFNTSRLSAQDATQQSGAMQQQTENTATLNNQQGQINENLGSAADNRQISLQNNQGSINQALQKDNAAQQSALSAQQYGQQSSLQSQGAEEAKAAAEQAFMQSLGLASQQFDFQKILSDQAYRQQIGISEQDFLEAQTIAQQEFNNQSALSAQQAEQQKAQTEQDFNFQKTLQEMDQNSRAALLQMQNENAALLQQSQSAANRFQDLAQQISAISTSPDMNPDQKALAIGQLMDLSNKSLATQAELLKAAGVSGVEMTETGATESGGSASLPQTPDDPQISFTPSEYDRGNLDALRAETARLGELANKLPANTAEGVKVRQSHIQAQLKDLDIQYYSTTSANAQRQIRGEMGRKQAELNRLNQQAAQYLQPTQTPAEQTQAGQTQVPAAQPLPDWSQLFKTIKRAGFG